MRIESGYNNARLVSLDGRYAVEIELLKDLEKTALRVRQSDSDRKWDELSSLLQNNSEMFDAHGHRRKLVIFTEHRDTLNYLTDKIRALIGRNGRRPDANRSSGH